jgi:hypothetical protein
MICGVVLLIVRLTLFASSDLRTGPGRLANAFLSFSQTEHQPVLI